MIKNNLFLSFVFFFVILIFVFFAAARAQNSTVCVSPLCQHDRDGVFYQTSSPLPDYGYGAGQGRKDFWESFTGDTAVDKNVQGNTASFSGNQINQGAQTTAVEKKWRAIKVGKGDWRPKAVKDTEVIDLRTNKKSKVLEADGQPAIAAGAKWVTDQIEALKSPIELAKKLKMNGEGKFVPVGETEKLVPGADARLKGIIKTTK